MPVLGLPIFFFSRSAIALPLPLRYRKGEPGQGCHPAPGSDQQRLVKEAKDGWCRP
jgi:hypothetical protein